MSKHAPGTGFDMFDNQINVGDLVVFPIKESNLNRRRAKAKGMYFEGHGPYLIQGTITGFTPKGIKINPTYDGSNVVIQVFSDVVRVPDSYKFMEL